MHDYVKVRIEPDPCDETITDLLAAFLADEEFESFEPDKNGLTAYVRKDSYRREAVENILQEFPIAANFSFNDTIIEGEDWNKQWEQNYFKPILIDDKLVVRSSFHQDFPKASLEIIIDPKMAFGTGHHSTTAGMSRMLMQEDLQGKTVIDMGTGTGILSILVKKLGAAKTTGIDIDPFAIENAQENGDKNGVDITWITGDDRVLVNLTPVDIFLANINLNVIKANLAKYLSYLKSGGKLFLSGFLSSDKEEILKESEKAGLKSVRTFSENDWLTMVFIKK